jgi:hypothetical protein
MILSKAVAWLNYCDTFRSPETGEIVFYGAESDAFMAGEMYRYLSKAVERMAKQNVRKTATLKYREKYRLGVACQLHYRIHEIGDAGSWAPQRERKLLAVQKAMDGEITIVRKDWKLTGTSGAAFMRGATAGKDISLNKQTTGHGGRYLEGR